MTKILRLLAGFVLATSIIGPGAAKPSPSGAWQRLDYTWWQKADSVARAGSVRAAILASMTGWELGFSAARAADTGALAATNATDAASAVNRAPTPRGPLYPRSLSYYVSAVDALYAQHPRARRFEVPDVLYSCLQARFSKDDCNRIIKRDDTLDGAMTQHGKRAG